VNFSLNQKNSRTNTNIASQKRILQANENAKLNAMLTQMHRQTTGLKGNQAQNNNFMFVGQKQPGTKHTKSNSMNPNKYPA
jgi:hypothetical protein